MPISENPCTDSPIISHCTMPAPMAPGDAEACLLVVMRNERNRAMLASLEENLSSFLANDDLQTLPFPPKSAFFCKVCQAVAQRYKLEFRMDKSFNLTPGLHRFILLKTPCSAAPVLRISQNCLSIRSKQSDGNYGELRRASSSENTRVCRRDEETETTQLCISDARQESRDSPEKRATDIDVQPNPQGTCVMKSSGPTHTPVVSDSTERDSSQSIPSGKPATVLRRRAVSSRASGMGSNCGDIGLANSTLSAGGGVKNITEEEYEMARARIFRKDNVQDCDDVAQFERVATGREQGNLSETYAKGPTAGSIGFARGRSQRPQRSNLIGASMTSGGLSNSRDCENAVIVSEKSESLPAADNGVAGCARLQHENQPFYSAGAVDRHDPDFDRRYCKWVPQALSGQVTPMASAYSQSFLSGDRRNVNLFFEQSEQLQHGFRPAYREWGVEYAPDIRYEHVQLNSISSETKRNPGSPSYHPSGRGVLNVDAETVEHRRYHNIGYSTLSDMNISRQNGAVPEPTSLLGLQHSSIWVQPHPMRMSGWPLGDKVASREGSRVGDDHESATTSPAISYSQQAQPSYGLDSLTDFPVLSRNNAVPKS